MKQPPRQRRSMPAGLKRPNRRTSGPETVGAAAAPASSRKKKVNNKNRVISAVLAGHSVLKLVIVGDVHHNILYAALQNIAELINGVHFHIFVVTKPINLSTVNIVVGVQIILGNTALTHGFP